MRLASRAHLPQDDVIVMGASLGGVRAIQYLLKPLPAEFASPIIVALHRHRDSDGALAELVQRNTALRVCEADDKQLLEAGKVYLAPPDYHTLIDADRLALSIDDAVRFARPSIDVLFESAAPYGERVVAVVLTGGGADGAQGAAAIEAKGGRVLVQDPEEAMCGDLPTAAIAATARAEVLSLDGIASRLTQLVASEG